MKEQQKQNSEKFNKKFAKITVNAIKILSY